MKLPSPGIDCCCWSILLLSLAQAVPVARGPNSGESQRLETANSNYVDLNKVCLYENAVYTEGQNFTTSNPCETCICHPPAFACSLRTCDMKPGCKAIHSASKCCPEYSCECERNGKTYGNGEKVEEPQNPCKICYCKGGEIKCSEITCYTREDCEPIYTPGICCPKYDHCPLLDTLKNQSIPPNRGSLVVISDLTTPGVLENKNTSFEETSSEIPESTESSKGDSNRVATLEIIEIHPNLSTTPMYKEITKPKFHTTTKIPEEESTWAEDGSIAEEEISNDFETTTTEITEANDTQSETSTVPFDVNDLPPIDSNVLNLARMRNQSEENDTLSEEVVVWEEIGNSTSVDEEYERVENSTADAELPARIGEEITTTGETTTEETTTERAEEESSDSTEKQESSENSKKEESSENSEKEERSENSEKEESLESVEKEELRIGGNVTAENLEVSTTTESTTDPLTTTVSSVTSEDLIERITVEDLILSTIAPLVESTTVTESAIEETTADVENLMSSTVSATEFDENFEGFTARYVASTEGITVDFMERLEMSSTTYYESTTEAPTTEGTTYSYSTGKLSGRMISDESLPSTEDSVENLSTANDSSEIQESREASAEELTTKHPAVYRTYAPIVDRITVVPPEKIQEATTDFSGEQFENASISEEHYEFENATSGESSEEDSANSTNIPFKYPAEDGAAPVVVMISADQIQFLKVGEEPPLYIENPSSSVPQENNKNNHEEVIVPKTTPLTVQMIKVVNAKVENETEEIDFTTEFPPDQNSTYEYLISKTDSIPTTEEDPTTKEISVNEPTTFNATGIIQER